MKASLVLFLALIAPKAFSKGNPFLTYLHQIETDGSGLHTLLTTSEALHWSLSHFSPSARALSAYKEGDEVIKSGDFGDFFDLDAMTKEQDGGVRGTITGHKHNKTYIVDVSGRKLEELQFPHNGDLGVAIAIKEVANPVPDMEAGFGVGTRGKIASGPLSHVSIYNASRGLSRLLGREAEPRDDQGQSIPELFRKTLPRFSQNIGGFTQMAFKVGTRTPYKGKPVKDISIFFSWDIDAISKIYPALGSYLDKLSHKMALRYQSHVKNAKGSIITRIDLDVPQKSLAIHWSQWGQKLLPYNEKNRLQYDQAVSYDINGSYALHTASNLKITALGFTIEQKDFEILTEIASSPRKFHSHHRVTKFAPPHIEGRFLGILPTWLIDLTIPNDIDYYSLKFAESIRTANQGQGSIFNIEAMRVKPTEHLWSFGGSSQFIDDVLLEIGMGILSTYLIPSTKALDDIRRLALDATDALAKDCRENIAS